MKYLLPLLTLLTLLGLSGCKPDELEIEVYTSDVEAVREQELLMVPVKASFKLLGDDKEGQLAEAKVIAQKYLPDDSQIDIVDDTIGKLMVVSTRIPFGTGAALEQHAQQHTFLAALVADERSVRLLSNEDPLKQLNRELRTINFMLSMELPATDLTFRVVSDSRQEFQVAATAIFVDNKPYLQFETALKRRDAVELNFKGADASVYSQIDPVFLLTAP